MARTHNIQLFATMVAQAGYKDITWDLGATGKYIKTVYHNGNIIVSNGQQHNMSTKNPDLFDVVDGNMYLGLEKDLSPCRTFNVDVRPHRNKRLSDMQMTYAKDELFGDVTDFEIIRTLKDANFNLGLIKKNYLQSIVFYVEQMDKRFCNDEYLQKEIENSIPLKKILPMIEGIEDDAYVSKYRFNKFVKLMGRFEEMACKLGEY